MVAGKTLACHEAKKFPKFVRIILQKPKSVRQQFLNVWMRWITTIFPANVVKYLHGKVCEES